MRAEGNGHFNFSTGLQFFSFKWLNKRAKCDPNGSFFPKSYKKSPNPEFINRPGLFGPKVVKNFGLNLGLRRIFCLRCQKILSKSLGNWHHC